MTFRFRITSGSLLIQKVLGRFRLARLVLVLGLAVAAWPARAEDAACLEVETVTVNGKSAPIQGQAEVNLGPFPDNVVFGFGSPTYAQRPIRARYTLEGYETAWHEITEPMDFSVRFYDDSGEYVSQETYSVSGESTGWARSLKNSQMRHRRETLLVPPEARHLLVAISSAGPPDTVGIYVVANIMVTKSSGTPTNQILLQSPLDSDLRDPPAGWMRDGRSPSMARIVKIGQNPQTRAFAIIDTNRASHGEWHSVLSSSPVVTPGDNLVVEWNEMFSTGAGNYREAVYSGLSAGHYKFRLQGVNVMGAFTYVQTSLDVFVPQPFWKTPWFWGVAVVAITAMMAGISRYVVWHRMQFEMIRLKHQRAVEQERLRIAHDIHDDLGARVTQISLLSAMAQDTAAVPEKARADFAKITEMARDLVSALYETVWAVNPENDNLEAQGNYLCQMVNQLCERTSIHCRFHVLGLPGDVRVSSQTRHNINMVVKEAVHNVIKHSRASEVTIRMTCADGILNIAIEDNGVGFEPGTKAGGNGLANMKKRLANLGGSCVIESQPGKGTKVRMSLSFQSLDHASGSELASTEENL